MDSKHTGGNDIHLGSRVRTWDGHLGRVVGVKLDGWFEVHIDGETTCHGTARVDEWPDVSLTPEVFS